MNLKTNTLHKEAVYIGRPSLWGNPYRLSTHSRQEAIQLYESYLLSSGLIKHLHRLKFKQLACFCFPEACHGEVLLKHLIPLEAKSDILVNMVSDSDPQYGKYL